MKSKVRPILVKKGLPSTPHTEGKKVDLAHTEVTIAAKRAKKAIMDNSVRSSQILIVEED